VERDMSEPRPLIEILRDTMREWVDDMSAPLPCLEDDWDDRVLIADLTDALSVVGNGKHKELLERARRRLEQ
jgi:hypothetical protein